MVRVELKTSGLPFDLNLDVGLDSDKLASECDLIEAEDKIRAALTPAFDAVYGRLCGLVMLKKLYGDDDDND